MVRYIHKQRKNKRGYTLKVENGGEVSVITNKHCSKSVVEKIIVKNLGWIKSAKINQKNKKLQMEKSIASLKLTNKKIINSKESAFVKLNKRTIYLARKNNLENRFGNLEVKNYKSKWGTCDSKGNITLNWRLQLLPKDLRDYVIIHELCHLQYMNHSKNFWLLVETFCNNYKSVRKLLRDDYSLLMNIE